MDYYMEKLIKNNICAKKEITASEYDSMVRKEQDSLTDRHWDEESREWIYYMADLDEYTSIKTQSAILSTLKTIKNILLISFILGLIGACFCAFKVIPVILEFAEYMY